MAKRINVIILMVCAAALLLSTSSFAQDKYPSKGIEMVIPWAPGGPADVGGRIFINELGKLINVPLTPVNKDGATGTVGALYVHKAKKDGYTLLIGSASWYQASLTLSDLPYNVMKDFIPIVMISTTPHGIFVNSESGAKTLEELIDKAKKTPNSLSCGTAGTASGGHFNLEILQKGAGIKMKHVPFKGNAEVPPAVLGGHVDCGIGAITGALPLASANKLKFLAVTGTNRSKSLPEVPTFKEKGANQHYLENWVALYVPAGVPTNVLEALTEASMSVLKSKEFAEKVEKSGSEALYLVRKDLEKYLDNEKSMIEPIAKDLGLVK